MATGVDAKLLKSTKFPPEFSQKVDMTKVNLQVMKKYVKPALAHPVPMHPDATDASILVQMDSRKDFGDLGQ